MKEIRIAGEKKIQSCHDCPYQRGDQYNPSRFYCGKLSEKYDRNVEISVNLAFPIICPLEKENASDKEKEHESGV